MRSGLTMTRAPGWNSMKFTPPNVAAYWSCRPPPSPASIRSISNARCAISYSPSGRLSHSTNAFTKESTMVEEVPRPEPGGASQKVVIRHGSGRPLLNCVTMRRYTARCSTSGPASSMASSTENSHWLSMSGATMVTRPSVVGSMMV